MAVKFILVRASESGRRSSLGWIAPASVLERTDAQTGWVSGDCRPKAVID